MGHRTFLHFYSSPHYYLVEQAYKHHVKLIEWINNTFYEIICIILTEIKICSADNSMGFLHSLILTTDESNQKFNLNTSPAACQI